ncbi:MAG: hypothetical protein AAFR79_03295 [Pseudomonadota bacterium]
MEPKPYPARLHALIARKARVAVVIRRGPAKEVASCLWDLESDAVTLGQWLKGRIYERRCAIAPDGRYWIYFAATHHPEHPLGGSWTAVARAPWLKALYLWAKGDAWNGGGGFTDRRTYWLNGAHGEAERASHLKRAESPLGAQRNNECLGIYFPRLVREGWTELSWSRDRAEFSKPLARGWGLHKTALSGPPAPGRGVYWDEHLVETPEGDVLARPDWEWAERDGPDIVYAERGCLWRQRILDRSTLSEPRLIHDFTPMIFEAREAPS